MPLPNDEKLLALARDVLQQFDAIFGLHPGFRPAHAKGVMLTGTFTPSAEAASLCRAPHFNQASTPVSVRFSNSTGIPVIPDNDPNADPRGIAVRFHLAERVHTDIICHSTDGFPARTGQGFLEFMRAAAGGTIEAFLAANPAALAFVQAPKPAPSSFARQTYFGVTALQFFNQDGASRFGRFRIIPDAGNDPLSPEASKGKSADYLFDEIKARVGGGPIGFEVAAQLANDGDIVDDATIHWPADRPVVSLGKFTLNGLVADNPGEQKHTIFDPIPRVDGIEPSADPLLELRAALYLISGRRRRAA